MKNIEDYTHRARSVVMDTVSEFHVAATLDNETVVEVPFSYQIAEPGFRPYRSGKASPDELRAQFERIVEEAHSRDISLGLESRESVQKLLVQNGLGVDCSRFAYQAMTRLHEHMGLASYDSTVLWPADMVRELGETRSSWQPKDEHGQDRDLTEDETTVLANKTGLVDVEWMSEVFGKDPEFIVGSAQLCSDDSTVAVAPRSLLPGDAVSFQSAATGAISHLGVIEEVRQTETSIRVDFWHSWHTRDYESGVRSDFVEIGQDGAWSFSHQGLNDKTRYQAYGFRRPNAIARYVGAITGVL